jgi:hypothetical protein
MSHKKKGKHEYGGKKHRHDHEEKKILKERCKLLKVLVLMSKVYKKGAKNRIEREAYQQIEKELSRLRHADMQASRHDPFPSA